MTDSVDPVNRLNPVRRAAGLALAAVTVLTAVGFGLGAWNPWRLVVLTEYFGNWPLGCLLVAVVGLVASWVLLPVRHEVVQGPRIALRVGLAVAAVLSLACWGIVGSSFNRQTTVLARSAAGDRAVVLVVRGVDDRELRVWAGNGLAARDVGALGPACGQVDVRFAGPAEVTIATSYGDFRIGLDPDTGAPRGGIGASCSGTG